MMTMMMMLMIKKKMTVMTIVYMVNTGHGTAVPEVIEPR